MTSSISAVIASHQGPLAPFPLHGPCLHKALGSPHPPHSLQHVNPLLSPCSCLIVTINIAVLTFSLTLLDFFLKLGGWLFVLGSSLSDRNFPFIACRNAPSALLRSLSCSFLHSWPERTHQPNLTNISTFKTAHFREVFFFHPSGITDIPLANFPSLGSSRSISSLGMKGGTLESLI